MSILLKLRASIKAAGAVEAEYDCCMEIASCCVFDGAAHVFDPDRSATDVDPGAATPNAAFRASHPINMVGLICPLLGRSARVISDGPDSQVALTVPYRLAHRPRACEENLVGSAAFLHSAEKFAPSNPRSTPAEESVLFAVSSTWAHSAIGCSISRRGTRNSSMPWS